MVVSVAVAAAAAAAGISTREHSPPVCCPALPGGKAFGTSSGFARDVALHHRFRRGLPKHLVHADCDADSGLNQPSPSTQVPLLSLGNQQKVTFNPKIWRLAKDSHVQLRCGSV